MARHHFVPKAILRNFCFAGETTHYVSAHRKHPTAEQRNIETIFCKRHLNSFKRLDGTRDASLERFYSATLDDKISGVVAEVRSAIQKSGRVDLAPTTANFLRLFLYHHARRTPEAAGLTDSDLREFVQEQFPSMREKAASMFGEDAASYFFSDESSGRLMEIARSSRAQVRMKEYGSALDAIQSMSVVFAIPRGQFGRFVVTSNPVLRLTNDGNTNLVHGDVELWTTLAPDFALGLCKTEVLGGLIYLADDAVHHINQNLSGQSTALAGRDLTAVRFYSQYLMHNSP